MTDDATRAQIRAADPGANTWLSANAGSGKTRVLTDRVARLLLNGVGPQHILCLTYTKAAASEMQNRLFARLGEWAMLDDEALSRALNSLGAGEGGAARLREARRLFARAIETPGGLKIQTIHSFCASLLRRFPLEAGVTPQFVEIDDRTSRLLRAEVVEEIADGPRADLLDALAAQWTGEDTDSLTAEICRHREGFAGLDRAGALKLFAVPPDLDRETLLAEVFLGREADLCRDLCALLATGGTRDQAAGAALSALRLDAPDLGCLAALEKVFLYGAEAKAGPFAAKIGAFPTKALQKTFARMEELEAFMGRVETARAHRIALMAAEKTLALHRFAEAFLAEYDRRKAARGWLDFDDLIVRTRRLLTDPAAAQWVLFRLDGGIDHILVDEAQDTSPEQWRVIALLAQEFSAGEGARQTPRTIFVVGDKKQSIYSFQGADLNMFETMRRDFRDRLAAVRVELGELTLDYSFRSSRPVLRAVDATFAAAPGLGGAPRHLAFFGAMPGRVDLWPLLAPAADPEERDWFEAVDARSDTHPEVLLAQGIADQLRSMIEAGTMIPDGDGARRLTAGDVMILVRRRSSLFHEIIRACKQAGLPVAGADRLKLAAEIAIRDLSALMAFLVTPEDDLSLACALRSPLFGWSEAQLYDLAQGRPGYLWEALRRRSSEFVQTHGQLVELLRVADYLRPYELLERILTRDGGREKLLARLGQEAEDGMDALLAQALAFEQMEVPSLAGFASWLAAGEVEVKRQMDAAGGRLRVMTVHGAKGLESALVVLPDAGPRMVQLRDEILPAARPIWRVSADASPAAAVEAMETLRLARQEEDQRLLYVAMTRAEKWLIVCGTQTRRAGSDPSWHDMVAAGIQAAAGEGLMVEPLPTPAGEGLRLHGADWPAPAPALPEAKVEAPPSPPDWLFRHPAPEPEDVPLLSPSALGGAKALFGEGAGPVLTEEEAMARGSRLHLLLEHLPAHRPASWPDLGRDLLAAQDPTPTEAEMADLIAEATAVLTTPGLDWLFAPDTLAEVDIAAPLASAGGRRMLGTIDRLVVTRDRVLAVDFKSNAVVPATPEAVPEGILRQMAAYAEGLALIFPSREIETAILWTRTGRFMTLPPALIRQAAAALAGAVP